MRRTKKTQSKTTASRPTTGANRTEPATDDDTRTREAQGENDDGNCIRSSCGQQDKEEGAAGETQTQEATARAKEKTNHNTNQKPTDEK